MAARRLIIVLLALFAVSIVAAAIAPERDGSLGGDTSSETTSSTTTAETPPEQPPDERSPDTSDSLTTRIEASDERQPKVEAFVGDQLELEVASEKPREIEVPDFGLIETAEPDTPAIFNLLLREAGEFAITDAQSGATLGRLLVRKPEAR